MNNIYNGIFNKLVKVSSSEPNVSSLSEDFLAGVDPLGYWTADYGVEAEKAKLSEEEHALKRGIGTLGGLIGGATVIPSTIFGIIGGVKGIATTPGNIKEKLLGGASGFISGFKKPIAGPIAAFRARAALKDVADKGVLTQEGAKAIKELGEYVPVAEVLSTLPKTEMSAATSSFMKEIMETAEKLEGGIIDKVRAVNKIRSIAKNLTPEQKIMVEEAKTLPEMYQRFEAGKDVIVTQNMQEQARKLHEASAVPIAEALAGLGLGGVIGSGGAYIQYGKGRAGRRSFEEEIRGDTNGSFT